MDIQRKRSARFESSFYTKQQSKAVRSVEDAQSQVASLKNEDGAVFLLSRGKRQTRFYTEDSKLYITPKEQWQFSRGFQRQEQLLFDAASSRFIRKNGYVVRKRVYDTQLYRRYWKLRRSYFGLRTQIVSIPDNLAVHVSPVKVWNFSIIGAIIFGMISMSFIYRYLGQGVMAKDEVIQSVGAVAIEQSVSQKVAERVLGEEVVVGETEVEAKADATEPPVEEEPEITPEMLAQQEFEEAAREMVAGYPIEKMLPYIFEQERIVAAYLIAIAKKESAWGKRVPVYKGEDCFNYWGYRGKRKVMGSGGHTCFDSPRDAVETVGERVKWFVKQKGYDTPEKLVVWKCGYSCEGHSPTSVKKWISDIDMYFSKLYTKD